MSIQTFVPKQNLSKILGQQLGLFFFPHHFAISNKFGRFLFDRAFLRKFLVVLMVCTPSKMRGGVRNVRKEFWGRGGGSKFIGFIGEGSEVFEKINHYVIAV